MAAPTDTGLGLGVHGGEAVHELEKGSHGLGLSAEDPIGFDDKNGEEDEEVPVAKKARVEKADNGLAADDADDAGFGVESVEGFAEKDVDETELDPLLGHDNGAPESPLNDEVDGEGEGEDEDDSENGGVGGADDDDESAEVDAVTGKDAPGDAGLRTLLHDGDTTKTGGLLNGTDADTHTLNGAK